MAEPIPPDEQTNYETFRDCFSEPVLKALAVPIRKQKAKKKKKRALTKSKEGKHGALKENETETNEPGDAEEEQAAAEDLGEFIDYLSSLIFPSFPTDIRTSTYTKCKDTPQLKDRYGTPLPSSTVTKLINTIPPTAIDSLESYGLLPPNPDATDQYNFFSPLLTAYASAVTAPPPIWSTTRTTECELCGRSWIPLTYHHLIPKSTHERVLKRRWHSEEKLNSVAWLCSACHSFVHRLANNEELAKGLYTVELILRGGEYGEKRGVVEGWVKWVGGVRWKSR